VRRLLVLVALMALLWYASLNFLPGLGRGAGRLTATLGFLLLAAFTAGELVLPLRLPRITGCLLAGLLFGPSALDLVTAESLARLKVIDSLALTFIALSAGGELKLSELRRNRRLIGSALTSLLLVVFVGTTLLVLAARPLFAFTRELGGRDLLVMAAILGAIATARSPASAIAIIKETRARGRFTDVAMGLTLAMDILAIVVFALVASAGTALLSDRPMEAGYVLGLLLEIGLSLGIGAGLGLALAAWLSRVRSHNLITIFLLAIVVSEVSQAVSQWLEARYGLAFHLEPMLICIATGFVVRNFSAQGARFLDVLDRGGLMVFTVFFALAGAGLDLDILRRTWGLALLVVGIRFAAIQAGAWLGAWLAGAGPVYRRWLGMTFVTQAGVSLGLAKAVEIRFPGWGTGVATLAVAAISLNQLLGPVLFKQALTAAGDAGAAAPARRRPAAGGSPGGGAPPAGGPAADP